MAMNLQDIRVELLGDVKVFKFVPGAGGQALRKHFDRGMQGEGPYLQAWACFADGCKERLHFIAAERVDDEDRLKAQAQELARELSRHLEEVFVFLLVRPVGGDDHAPQGIDFKADPFRKMLGELLRQGRFTDTRRATEDNYVGNALTHLKRSTCGLLQDIALQGRLQVFMILDTSVERLVQRISMMSCSPMFPSGCLAKGIRR